MCTCFSSRYCSDSRLWISLVSIQTAYWSALTVCLCLQTVNWLQEVTESTEQCADRTLFTPSWSGGELTLAGSCVQKWGWSLVRKYKKRGMNKCASFLLYHHSNGCLFSAWSIWLWRSIMKDSLAVFIIIVVKLFFVHEVLKQKRRNSDCSKGYEKYLLY